MMADPSTTSISTIASCGRSCSRIFSFLAEGLKESVLKDHLPQALLEEESRRFELWARNIAALQDARLPSSLEYRIKNDQNAIGVVKKSLSYLEESLDMALAIISGKKENQIWPSSPIETEKLVKDVSNTYLDPGSQQDNTSSTNSELKELSLAIKEAITNLFELSMIIRKKPEQDEYLKAAAKHPLDPTSDIVHVGDKYAHTRSGQYWLRERLGTAITRRRQYLYYRREHQKLMEETHMIKHIDGKTVWSGEKASTYQEGDFHQPRGADPLTMTQIVSQLARTEYADSSKGKDGAADLLRTPLLPRNANGVRAEYGQHFECSLCWRPQVMQNKNEWKKHVFSDLRPYVCTFEDCGLNMFESQHQWFDHELRFHRMQYLCQICDNITSMTRPQLEKHISRSHPGELVRNALDEILDSGQIPRIDASDCPLCVEYGERLQQINQSQKCDVSLKQFQVHLGRHMEQLALSALPEDDLDEDDDSGDSLLSMEIPLPSRNAGSAGTLSDIGAISSTASLSSSYYLTPPRGPPTLLEPTNSRRSRLLKRLGLGKREQNRLEFTSSDEEDQSSDEDEQSSDEDDQSSDEEDQGKTGKVMGWLSRKEPTHRYPRSSSSRVNSEEEEVDQGPSRPPLNRVPTGDPSPSGTSRRISRKAVPGLPRQTTFKRQQSERREKLVPADHVSGEWRETSMEIARKEREQKRPLYIPRRSSLDRIISEAAADLDMTDGYGKLLDTREENTLRGAGLNMEQVALELARDSEIRYSAPDPPSDEGEREQGHLPGKRAPRRATTPTTPDSDRFLFTG
ncbi:hypothetical protein B0O99DRAFT_37904 [Bisporella sp. PMI_857]|nr:hypothetical protein B0O99DRAFT_37904 [Bisporella sp. PMI_857]